MEVISKVERQRSAVRSIAWLDRIWLETLNLTVILSGEIQGLSIPFHPRAFVTPMLPTRSGQSESHLCVEQCAKQHASDRWKSAHKDVKHTRESTLLKVARISLALLANTPK